MEQLELAPAEIATQMQNFLKSLEEELTRPRVTDPIPPQVLGQGFEWVGQKINSLYSLFYERIQQELQQLLTNGNIAYQQIQEFQREDAGQGETLGRILCD